MDLKDIRAELTELRNYILKVEEEQTRRLERVHPDHRGAAQNLIHYLALRAIDHQMLQEQLTSIGLSSLRNSEARVLDNLNLVLHWLSEDQCNDIPVPVQKIHPAQRMKERADKLFGHRDTWSPHIMVTLSSQMNNTPAELADLLRSGMSAVRINCGHDSEQEWTEMLESLRLASEETGESCSVYFDLSGPKIRIKELFDKQRSSVKALPVKPGDRLFISKYPYEKAHYVKGYMTVRPKKVFVGLEVGKRILFDDGIVHGEVVAISDEGAEIEITYTDKASRKLKPEKGVNFPGKGLKLKAVTAKDITDLDFLKDHADVVGLSFVNNASDVHQIIDEMEARGMHETGLVVKIETASAFEDLPIILLALMRHKRIGLMIARGDLGLEVGWERLAEVQEEILWLAEAGWIPTIWATQVLEKLTKQGIPTRAEITDAAAGIRAECVMLNKGKYILNSVRTLSDILTKMSSHHYHRRPAMRKLNVAERFLNS